MPDRQRPLRVGMIGANWGIVGHLPAWRNLPGVEVAAICTAHEETARAAADAHGIPHAYHDYRRMIDEAPVRSEEHTSELQSLMRISYAVFCLKTKKTTNS